MRRFFLAVLALSVVVGTATAAKGASGGGGPEEFGAISTGGLDGGSLGIGKPDAGTLIEVPRDGGYLRYLRGSDAGGGAPGP
jgi:hypothetical protein